jgi:hypothetical protein
MLLEHGSFILPRWVQVTPFTGSVLGDVIVNIMLTRLIYAWNAD